MEKAEEIYATGDKALKEQDMCSWEVLDMECVEHPDGKRQ